MRPVGASTCFRIGSDQYAQTNGTYGLTTVLCLHVDCQNRETVVAFDYPAKGGKHRVAAIVRLREGLPHLARHRAGRGRARRLHAGGAHLADRAQTGRGACGERGSRISRQHPAVCRASYINPRVVELYEEGHTVAPALTLLGEGQSFGRPATQGAIERAGFDLLTSH